VERNKNEEEREKDGRKYTGGKICEEIRKKEDINKTEADRKMRKKLE
jgi:hypothetical protein